MNLMRTEVKRVLNRRSFLILFCLFVAAAIVLVFQYKDNFKVNYSVELSVIDRDKSEKSQAFLERLGANRAIHLTEGEEEDLEHLKEKIKKGELNACLIVPEDFFEDLPNAKMELIYSEFDVVAPAVIDLISQNFVDEVSEKTMLKKLGSLYSEREVERARKHFESLKKENTFDLEVIKEPYTTLAGIGGSASIDDINGFRSILMYLITFNFLFVALSLQLFRQESKGLIARMQVARGANRSYFVSSSAVLHGFFLAVPAIACLSSLLLLKMKLAPFFYLCFASLAVSLFLFELIGFLNSILRDENISFTINVLLIIFLSLVGGAFFSLDIMPKAFINMASFSPFFVLSGAFYEAIDGVYSSIGMAALYFIGFVGLYGLNLRLYSVRR